MRNMSKHWREKRKQKRNWMFESRASRWHESRNMGYGCCLLFSLVDGIASTYGFS